MFTPYPFNSQSLSSTQSHHQSNSLLTSSVNNGAGHLEHGLYEISSSAQHINPGLTYESAPVDDHRPLQRPTVPISDHEIKLARLRHKNRNELVTEPRSPPHRDDFPGKPAEGDPASAAKGGCRQLNGPRWSDEEYHRSLAAAMSRRFPPDLAGAAEARRRSEQQGGAAAAPRRQLEGFRRTLDLLKEIKRGNRAEFAAWSEGRGVLERALAAKAANLRAEHALHAERMRQEAEASAAAEHGPRRRRRYHHHLREMRQTLRAVHEVAGAAGVLYSERAAVAQGCVPRHGENWGKLDLAACDPTPYIHALFPEFVPPAPAAGPTPAQDHLAPPPPAPLSARLGVLDGAALAEAWDEECRPFLGALHRAAFRGEWYEVLDRSRAGAERARRVLRVAGCDDVRR